MASPHRPSTPDDLTVSCSHWTTTARSAPETRSRSSLDLPDHADREAGHTTVMASSSAYASNRSPTRNLRTSMNRLIFASTNWRDEYTA